MKNTFAQALAGSAILMVGTLASPSASAMDILARVISSTPVVQQVAVPRQVCNNEAVMTQAPKSGAGALMGAIAGGAAGNAIGNGGGRAAATMLGLLGGAIVGDRIEGPNSQVQNVQRCTTQTFYENRPSHYNVVYEYQGARYTAQMPDDPGLYVRLQVTPVGALPSNSPQANQSPQNYPPSQNYQPTENYQSAPSSQPQTYYQPAPVQQQPVYIQQPVYVQPAPPVVYPSYYNRPYYPPIGLSLNFGYSRSYGGGHRHHHGPHGR
jgi:uncharacterized protein YcfJ